MASALISVHTCSTSTGEPVRRLRRIIRQIAGIASRRRTSAAMTRAQTIVE
ncbi:hypothetical protein K4X33_10810 [Brevibacterium casei]|nr:hypothetical protein K4X33_10810 [Brevibacterium casei]